MSTGNLKPGMLLWELIGTEQRLICICSEPIHIVNFNRHNKHTADSVKYLIKYRDGKTIHAGSLILEQGPMPDIFTHSPQKLVNVEGKELPWPDYDDNMDWTYHCVELQISGVSEYFCSFSYDCLTAELVDYLYDEVDTSVTFQYLKSAMPSERWRWIEEVTRCADHISGITLY